MKNGLNGAALLSLRCVALVVAVPASIYTVLVLRTVLVSGELSFMGSGVLMAPATLALLAWWFLLRGHIARSLTLILATSVGAVVIGGIGFLAGFLGPMILAPRSNQGPLLGIFVTGPIGFYLGAVAGFIGGLILTRRDRGVS